MTAPIITFTPAALNCRQPLFFRSYLFKVNLTFWALLIVSFALALTILHYQGLALIVRQPVTLIAFITGSLALTSVASLITRDENIFFFGSVLNQLIVASLLTDTVQYIGPWFALPLLDDKLIALDSLVGFSWLELIRWLNSFPAYALQIISGIYLSFTFAVVILVCTLFARKQARHAQKFVIAIYASGLLCGLLSGLFPSVGGYIFYNIDIKQYPHLNPAAFRMHEALYTQLRSHTVKSIMMPNVGVVTFPSYHTVMAVLMIYASLPLRYGRLFFIPLNLLMLLSIPSNGGHYLVDVLGGIAVAFIAVALARAILPGTSYPRKPV